MILVTQNSEEPRFTFPKYFLFLNVEEGSNRSNNFGNILKDIFAVNEKQISARPLANATPGSNL